MGQRRVDFHGLPGLLLLLLRRHVLEGTHVVQPVRQLDHDDADVLRHGKEHFPQILRLHLHLVSVVGQLSQFGHTVHQKSHLIRKLLSDLLLGHNRILHHIVENAGHNGLLIQLQIRQNDGDAEGMDDIFLAGFAHLSPVGLPGHMVGFLNHGDIRVGMVLADPGNQLVIEFLRADKILRLDHAFIFLFQIFFQLLDLFFFFDLFFLCGNIRHGVIPLPAYNMFFIIINEAVNCNKMQTVRASVPSSANPRPGHLFKLRF